MFSATRYGDGAHNQRRNRLTGRCRGRGGARALWGFDCDSCGCAPKGMTYTHLDAIPREATGGRTAGGAGRRSVADRSHTSAERKLKRRILLLTHGSGSSNSMRVEPGLTA